MCPLLGQSSMARSNEVNGYSYGCLDHSAEAVGKAVPLSECGGMAGAGWLTLGFM